MKKIKPIHVLMLKRITCSVLLQRERERERERQIEEMFATPKQYTVAAVAALAAALAADHKLTQIVSGQVEVTHSRKMQVSWTVTHPLLVQADGT